MPHMVKIINMFYHMITNTLKVAVTRNCVQPIVEYDTLVLVYCNYELFGLANIL